MRNRMSLVISARDRSRNGSGAEYEAQPSNHTLDSLIPEDVGGKAAVGIMLAADEADEVGSHRFRFRGFDCFGNSVREQVVSVTSRELFVLGQALAWVLATRGFQSRPAAFGVIARFATRKIQHPVDLKISQSFEIGGGGRRLGGEGLGGIGGLGGWGLSDRDPVILRRQPPADRCQRATCRAEWPTDC